MNEVTYRINGKVVSREEFFKRVQPKKNWLSKPAMMANTYSEHNPLVSQGCGVMPVQVGEARAMIKKHGIQGACVRDDGAVEFTSRRARKQFLHHRDLRDLDGGYSD